MESDASFGLWLRRRRKALDLTQDALAARVGCSVATIRKIETDERRPSRQIAELLANVLDIAPDERTLFLRVARGERRTEHLAGVAPPTERPLSAPMPRLPVPLTPLIGREVELAEVGRLLARTECRLLTLAGPGGIGKTRLAIAAAAEQRQAFADGAYFVALAPLSAPEFIVPTVAAAIGVAFYGSMEPKRQLLNYMREKEMLLVLDNVEHLLDGVGLLSELLQHAPNLKLLVTSRERLHLQGEWVVDLQGLPVPPLPSRAIALPTMAHEQSPIKVETYSAVALFVDRAQRVGFALSEQNRADVARICQLLEGMPLAIELAATWASALSCDEIAQEIEHNLDFLASSIRDVPERHRSLRAVFDHSWKLLSTAERQVLPRLSVFRGGFTREAAEQAAGATLPLLLALVSKSLVQPAVDRRFAVHELVRQYAEAYLDIEPGNATARPDGSSALEARRAHAIYYCALAEKVTPELYGPDQVAWLKRLEQEQDNIRAALIWALDQEAEIALRLASTLRPFWKLGRVPEGSQWLDKALQTAASSTRPFSATARAEALGAQSDLAIWLGNYTQARLLAEEALAFHRELGDRQGEAFSLLMLSWVAYTQDDYALGRSLATQSLALYQELGDKLGIADVLGLLGIYSNENYAEARTYLEQSLTLYREIGHLAGVGDRLSDLGILVLRMGDFTLARPWLEEGLAIQRSLGERRPTFSLVSLGELAFHEGNYEQARAYLEEGLVMGRETGEYHFSLWAFARLGHVDLRQGDATRARAVFIESQRRFNEASSKIGVVFALEGLASLAAAQGQPERAVRLVGWADTMRAAIGDLRPPVEQADLDRDLGPVRSQLDEAAFAAAYAAGRAMTIEQAVAYALME